MQIKIIRHHRVRLLCIALFSLVLNACDSTSSNKEPADEKSTSTPPEAPPQIEIAQSTYSVDDLDGIKKQGTLRILVPVNVGGERYLPRKGSPVDQQRALAQAFAESQGLKAELITLGGFNDMLPSLAEGKADMVAANVTITPARQKKMDFSIPITHVREQLIVRSDNGKITKKPHLDGLRVMAHPHASYWQSLLKLQTKYKGMVLVPRPENMTDEDEIDAMVAGTVDAVVRDSNIADMYLGYRDDIKVAFALGGQKKIAWPVRKNNPKLLAALNQFLYLSKGENTEESIYKDDLEGIKKRKVLRVVLRNNGASYFLYKGELLGFEYELAKAFAKSQGLRIEVIVSESHADMLELLRSGKADIAANFLSPVETQATRELSFSRPYHYATEHLLVAETSNIKTMADLEGKAISVKKTSPYWQSLQDLRETGVSFELTAADERLDTETLIEQLAAGDISATVADSHLVDIALAQGVGIHQLFILKEKSPHSVIARTSNPKLLGALNAFIKKNYKGLLYNVLYKKYFKNRRHIKRVADARSLIENEGKLSPFDKDVRELSKHYSFDWRMITAQMYQESQFDPKAVSFAGARGLMQVMPRTAKSMGITELDHPQKGLKAGVKYMNWLRERFHPSLQPQERIWFSLAAYNAGLGHVIDARKLAKQKGWDGDRWFGHVEKAMLLLRQKKYAAKARHGWVRGGEPVHYVYNIRQRFLAYVNMIDDLRVSSHTDKRLIATPQLVSLTH